MYCKKVILLQLQNCTHYSPLLLTAPWHVVSLGVQRDKRWSAGKCSIVKTVLHKMQLRRSIVMLYRFSLHSVSCFFKIKQRVLTQQIYEYVLMY